MDQAPLVREEIEAGAEFIRRCGQYAPVAAAYWLKGSDEENRHFYVASDRFGDRNTLDAYGQALRVIKEMNDLNLRPLRLRVVGVDDPVVRAVLDFYHRYPGRALARYDDRLLGGVPVDEVYIYPQPSAKP